MTENRKLVKCKEFFYDGGRSVSGHWVNGKKAFNPSDFAQRMIHIDYTAEKTRIASYIGKLLRERFGKGPESVYISVGYCCITIHVRNFLAPLEQFLLENNEEKTFRYTRELIMETLVPEIISFLQVTMGKEISELYYDWGLHNSSGMIVGISKSPFDDHPGWDEAYPGKEIIHEEIDQVSRKCQKSPERMKSFWLNPRTLIVQREGILILIEKELIGLGYDETLKVAKRRMEKRALVEYTNVGAIAGKKVTDIFVDWDFDKDSSVTVFTLKENTGGNEPDK